MPPVNRNQPIRAESSESRYSLMEFMREFPDDATCLEWLWRNRYSPDGVHADCPKCGIERAFKRYHTSQQRQSWTCTACGDHLHPTAGTIFHKSSTSLHLWFYAMYLMTSTRCGISAKQLERELGVTYKTAWRIAHEIRHVLMTEDGEPLSGAVEIDHTYIGGKRRGMGRGYINNKEAVFGAVERQGRVKAEHVGTVCSEVNSRLIRKHIMPSTLIYTDEGREFAKLGKRGWEHRRIRHEASVYVSGDIHTNTVEGFWSIVKRGISGTYHAVSARHLQDYLNEYAWRYNHRKDERAQFEELLLRGTLPS
jgi:transposase